MIGEKGFNTVCDVVNTFVIKDDRTLTAPLCFVFLLPFMIYFVVKGVKEVSENRLQSIVYLLIIVLSVGYWYWMFFGRFMDCPFPTH
ncbi:membrane protein [Xenorhabdus hominickii]|nr:membrane protein [Xenorhabdus hominickii]